MTVVVVVRAAMAVVVAVEAAMAALMAAKAAVQAPKAAVAAGSSRSDSGENGIRREADRGRREKRWRAFHPDLTTPLSETHWMMPFSTTTPSGPRLPQYFLPLTVS